MHRKLKSTFQAVSPSCRKSAPVLLAVVLFVGVEIVAQSTRPASVPPPASAAAEPRYTNATPIPEDMIRHRSRQVIALPSEPGEMGEDPLQMSGGAIGKLPPDVHRFPEGYVIAGARASLVPDPDWKLCYVPDERLVMSQAKDSAGWAVELDAGRVPAGLSKACQDKGVFIAGETRAIAEEPGSYWRLDDPRRVLFVQQEPDAMIVRAALPLRVLPNKMLMMMEAVISGSDKLPAFAITGRVTEFQGVNYILLEHLSEVMSSAKAAGEKPPASPAAATSDAGTAASAPAGKEPRAEDIIKRLLDDKPRRAVVLPQEMPTVTENKSTSPIAEGRPEQSTWPEETMIVDRPGRIGPGDKWWQFSFEDKALVPGKKPVRLLPNRMLENAIALGGDKTMGVVLVVSGEITEYRGTNYLLLRKVLVQRDMGNLK